MTKEKTAHTLKLTMLKRSLFRFASCSFSENGVETHKGRHVLKRYEYIGDGVLCFTPHQHHALFQLLFLI